MDATGLVLAFAGAIGSGKSALSRHVAEVLKWPRVSFGDYVRKVAREHGRDPTDRTVLQRLGQALVVSNPDAFVTAVLKQAEGWKPGGNLVVDGLRHAEVRYALSRSIGSSVLRLVFVNVDEDTRQERARSEKEIEPRLLSRYDQDITEAQISRILREYADMQVDNTLPLDIASNQILAKFNLSPEEMIAAE